MKLTVELVLFAICWTGITMGIVFRVMRWGQRP